MERYSGPMHDKAKAFFEGQTPVQVEKWDGISHRGYIVKLYEDVMVIGAGPRWEREEEPIRFEDIKSISETQIPGIPRRVPN